MAPLLHHLPEELLVNIVREVEQPSDLCSLTRVSDQFNRLATPELYRSVKLDAWRPELVQFTVTILWKPELAEFVEDLTIGNWNSERSIDSYFAARDLKQIGLGWPDSSNFMMLLSLESKACLHGYVEINSRTLYERVSSDVNRGAVISLLLCKLYNLSWLSLSVCYHTTDIEVPLWDLRPGYKKGYQAIEPLSKLAHVTIAEEGYEFPASHLLRAFLGVPSVKSITCIDFASPSFSLWDGYDIVSSSLESLDIYSCNIFPWQVAEILRACKDLKHFAYEKMDNAEVPHIFEPQQLLDILIKHSGKLESIAIYVQSGAWDSQESAATFASFKSLGNLHIQWDFFWDQRLEGAYTGSDDDLVKLETMIVPRVARVLPSSLHTLRFQACLGKDLTWLQELLRRKARCMPRVKDLLLDGDGWDWEDREILHSISNVAKEVGVKLTFTEPPPPSKYYHVEFVGEQKVAYDIWPQSS